MAQYRSPVPARSPHRPRRHRPLAAALIAAAAAAVSVAAASPAVAAGGPSPASVAAPATSPVTAAVPARQDVLITNSDEGEPSGFHLSTTTVQEGPITFRNQSQFGQYFLFRLTPGVTLDQLYADVSESETAAGAGAMLRDAVFYGLGGASYLLPAISTVDLAHGTYYIGNAYFGNTNENQAAENCVQLLRVNPSPSATPTAGVDPDTGVVGGRPTVSTTSTHRISIQGRLHAAGSLLLRNVSDTLNGMYLLPVKPGTTDAQIQAYYDHPGGASPYTGGPMVGVGPMSPAKQMVLAYVLPKGTYALFGEAWDFATDTSYAYEGMHQVVTLN